MSDTTTLLAFFLTSLAIKLTPGPNMAYPALVGVSRGRRDGFMAVLGVALGLVLRPRRSRRDKHPASIGAGCIYAR